MNHHVRQNLHNQRRKDGLKNETTTLLYLKTKGYKFYRTTDKFDCFDAYYKDKLYEIKSSFKQVFQGLEYIIIEPNKIEEFIESDKVNHLHHIIYYKLTGDIYEGIFDKSCKYLILDKDGKPEYHYDIDIITGFKRPKYKVVKSYYKKIGNIPPKCDIFSSDEE